MEKFLIKLSIIPKIISDFMLKEKGSEDAPQKLTLNQPHILAQEVSAQELLSMRLKLSFSTKKILFKNIRIVWKGKMMSYHRK